MKRSFENAFKLVGKFERLIALSGARPKWRSRYRSVLRFRAQRGPEDTLGLSRGRRLWEAAGSLLAKIKNSCDTRGALLANL